MPASDDLTATFRAAAGERAATSFARLVSVMARLRAPGGCPWDAKQTHDSLSIHMLEEAHEAVDAIDQGNMHALEEELGDVLLQVVFHSEIAAEAGHFEVADVVEELIAKLVQRHPHVFSDVVVSGPDEVVANWESIKGEARSRTEILDDVPKGLPALLLAHKVQRRLAGVGRDHPGTLSRLSELVGRLAKDQSDRAFGEVLFEVAALAGSIGIDPEGALRRAATGLGATTAG
ncbi:MAG: YabN family protein [Actinomycetota bacterium]